MRFDVIADLSELKANLCARIDTEAGQSRLLYITDTPGQQMVYQEKRREAEALKSEPDLPPEQTPHLTSEAAAFGVTRSEKASEILAQGNAWTAISARIESRRLTAKAAVLSAGSAPDARAAAVVDWADLGALATG